MVIIGFKQYQSSQYFLSKQVVFWGAPGGTSVGPSSTKRQIINHNWFVRSLLLFCVIGFAAAQLFVAIWWIGGLSLAALRTGEPYYILIGVAGFLMGFIVCLGALRMIPPIIFLMNTFRDEKQ